MTVIDLKTSQSDLVIEQNGYSEFVDVFATMSDNSTIKVNTDATDVIWKTDNQKVAVAYEGRILALGKGKAKVTVSYGGIEKTPTSPSTDDLKNSYKLLKLADAVVYRNSANTGGHVFIIAVNFVSESKVQCFEQTPYDCEITYWTYNQLAASKYMPFAKQ